MDAFLEPLTDLLRRPPGPVDRTVILAAAPFIGSFLGLLASRLPEGRPVLWGRSECESCGRTLGPLDLVPLISYLALRGRCRTCKARIPVALPAMEVAALGIAAWALLALGPAASLGLVLVTLGLGAVLLVLSAIDLEHFLLPDVLTLPLVAAGLAATALFAPEAFWFHGMAALAGYGALWLIAWGYRQWRGRDGLGMGDAKLFAAAGAWIGPLALPSVLYLGAFSGLLAALGLRLAGRELGPATAIPFGPFLALGLWLTWLYGPLQLALA